MVKRIATYLPTGQQVSVGRALKDGDSVYYTVTPTEVKPGEYLRSYQAQASQLRDQPGQKDPQSPGAPTNLPIPFASNSAPEVPRVPRDIEPPSGVDPSTLVWINDPNIGEEYIANKIKGIGVLSARAILKSRDEEHAGVFTNLDDIPLRIDSLKDRFTLVRVNQDPDLG
jgi:hypothetical protein